MQGALYRTHDKCILDRPAPSSSCCEVGIQSRINAAGDAHTAVFHVMKGAFESYRLPDTFLLFVAQGGLRTRSYHRRAVIDVELRMEGETAQ